MQAIKFGKVLGKEMERENRRKKKQAELRLRENRVYTWLVQSFQIQSKWYIFVVLFLTSYL